MSQFRPTFVRASRLSGGSPTAAGGIGGFGNANNLTATASLSSVVDPNVLKQGWKVGTLMEKCIEQLSQQVLELSHTQLDELPTELIVLLTQHLSHTHSWTAEILTRLRPFLSDIDAFSLAQCDFLRSELFTEVCKSLRAPLQSVDISRSYHLTDYSGLLKASLHECRSFDFDRCRRLNDSELEPLLRSASQRLETVKLSGTAVRDGTMEALRHCKNLTEIDLTSCVVSEGLLPLCQSTPLASLKLSGTNFNLVQLSSLDRCRETLHTLNLQFVHRIRNETLSHVGDCTRLTSLDLSRNSNLSDEGFAHLSKLVHLRTLNLSRTDLTDASAEVMKKFTQLTHLDVSYNIEVNDRLMVELCSHLSSLRVLILSCTGITNATVIDGIAPHSKQLQVLKLNGCSKVGNDAIDCIGRMATETPSKFIQSSTSVTLTSSSIQNGQSSPSSPSSSTIPSAALTAISSSAPSYFFPHSLLCLDIGSSSLTDASVESIGFILYGGIDSLQRVGIWGSCINPSRMKRHISEWTLKYAPSQVPTANDGDDSSANSSSSSSTASSNGLHPPSTDLSSSIWVLDESMRTQAGTFLFGRRRCESPFASIPRLATDGFMYGADEFNEIIRSRNKKKSVRFNDDCLVEWITIEPSTEWDDADDLTDCDDADSHHPQHDLTHSDDESESDHGSGTGSVVVSDGEDETGTRESSVIVESTGSVIENSAESSVVVNQ